MVQSVSLKFRVFCSPTAQDSVYFKAKWGKKKKKAGSIKHNEAQSRHMLCLGCVYVQV